MARRKRATYRTNQPPAPLSRLTRRFLIWTGAALALLLLLGAGGYLFLMTWLQGEGFRSYLAGAMQKAGGAAEVSIPQNISIDGSRITLPECTLSKAPLFRELSLRQLHVEVDRPALLRRWLRLRQVSVEELQLTLGSTPTPAAPQPQESAPQAPQAQHSDPEQATTEESPAPDTPALPTAAPQATGRSFFKGVQLTSFESLYTTTTLLTGPDGSRRYSMSGYHLTATPKRENSAWALNLENGRIHTPHTWLRECGLKNAKILCGDDEVRLSEARVLLTPGDMRLSGVFTPSSGDWNAQVDIHQANVARILNADWRKRLTGRLFGQLRFTGQHPGNWQEKGHLHLEKARLEGLPFLSDIKVGNTRPYRSLTLEKATCTLSYPCTDEQDGITNAWLWDNIDVRSTGGELLVRGRVLTGMDGALAGTLDIGLPAQVIADLGLSHTAAVAQLFSAPVRVQGYVWLRVNLSGTLAAPQEDLSVRLAAILPEVLPSLADQAVKSLGSALEAFLPGKSTPAEKAETSATDDPENTPKEAPAQPARQIQDAIKSGLDMIF